MALESRSIDESSETLEITEIPSESRFLYADSEPFPHDFDFIDALTGFVDLAAAVLTGAREARTLEADLAEARGALAHRVGTLDALLLSVSSAVTPASSGSDEPFLQSTVQRLERSAEDACFAARNDLERAFDAQRAKYDRAQAVILNHMVDATCTFLLSRELEVLSSDFSAELGEAGYTLSLTERLAGEITARYHLDAERTAFAEPKRVVDLVGPLSIEVGTRRSWLLRTVSMESRALDEYVIGSVRLEGDVADVGLRRRRDAEDTLSVHFAVLNGMVQAQVVRAEDPGVVFDVSAEDALKLRVLWGKLVEMSRIERSARSGLRSLHIDGEDALNGHGAELLVDRLVGVYGPMVAEVARRSRSHRELCLKRDLGHGRREERYVERAVLLRKLDVLEPHDRARLSALNLSPQRSLLPSQASIPELRSSTLPPLAPVNTQYDRR